MKLVLISDTHGQHEQLSLPGGDLLIHAGDVSSRGDELEISDFLSWFSKQDFEHKVFIAGNHDFHFDRVTQQEISELIPADLHYLNDSGVIIEGLKIWGSPVQPRFFDWAFNRDRGADIARHWEMIPKATDILITHGPPFGILDETVSGMNVGCEDLLETIRQTKVKLHVFGHIHEAYGVEESGGVKFVNASVLDFKYNQVNAPIVMELG